MTRHPRTGGADRGGRWLPGPVFWIVVALTLLFLRDRTWLMPGPVSFRHAPIERECGRCHPGFAATSSETCLACKNEMKYTEDRGIHRHAPVRRCGECHVEHRTRAYPLARAWVNPRRFDHGWTGRPMSRFHVRQACDACHKQTRYRDVPPDCPGCHRNFHVGLWDHGRTGCALDALHAGLACDRCHDRGWGEGKAPRCVPCHATRPDPRTVCGSEKARRRAR